MIATTPIPKVGFKEWQVVCDALASGRQCVLLRKGGIHEGREGFSFAHDRFFLFPTRFHASSDQVRDGRVRATPEWQPGESVRITHFAHASRAVTLFDWHRVASLEPCHIYTEEVVRDRFHWQGRNMPSGSIHVAMVEVYELATAWQFPYTPGYGGCRSWVELPAAPESVLRGARRVHAAPGLDERAVGCLGDL